MPEFAELTLVVLVVQKGHDFSHARVQFADSFDSFVAALNIQTEQGQCIMKERPLQEVEAGCGAASAPLRCAGLRAATAARE